MQHWLSHTLIVSIFKGVNMKTFQTTANYMACLHSRAGLIVQSTRTKKGVQMKPEHPQFVEYVTAFEESIDNHEADSLCKALLA